MAMVSSCKKDDDGGNEITFKPSEALFGIPFADPFILLDGDTYYAYGTGSTEVECYTSTDMKTWDYRGKALKNTDSYGDYWFWAPEVYRVGDRYLMYYSAQERVCVAEATSPLGPFTQKEKVPLFESSNYVIDGSMFLEDGQGYFYYTRGGSAAIFCSRLTEDLLHIVPDTEIMCFKQSQAWEFEAVNEGPFVYKYKDKYYMTYSGNGYTSKYYGDGLAIADHPEGPWEKYEGNPIFQLPTKAPYGTLEGVGHSAMFEDKDGVRRIVFHAHYKPGVVHPREMYISTFSFTDDPVPIMQISSEDIFKPLTTHH